MKRSNWMKLVLIVLAISMTLSLFACGDPETTTAAPGPEPTESESNTTTEGTDPESNPPETTNESDPETSEPETSEPETSEPETSEPETSEPETSAPETSEPETSEPETSEPETSEPETSEPETSEPESETEPEIPYNVYIGYEEIANAPTNKAFGKVEKHDGYVSFYGNGVNGEATVTVYSGGTKVSGAYLVVKYRYPNANTTIKPSNIEAFMSCTNSGAVAGDSNNFHMIADGEWHVSVLNMTERSTSNGFIPNADGTYTVKYVRLDVLNQKTPTTDCIDIAYFAITDDLQDVYDMNKDLKSVSVRGHELVEIDPKTGEEYVEIDTGAVVIPEIIDRVVCVDTVGGATYGPSQSDAAFMTSSAKIDDYGKLRVKGWNAVLSGVVGYNYVVASIDEDGNVVRETFAVTHAMATSGTKAYTALDTGVTDYLKPYLSVVNEFTLYDQLNGTNYLENGRYDFTLDLSAYHDELIDVAVTTVLGNGREISLIIMTDVAIGHTHWTNHVYTNRGTVGVLEADCNFEGCDETHKINCTHETGLTNVKSVQGDPFTYTVDCTTCKTKGVTLSNVTQQTLSALNTAFLSKASIGVTGKPSASAYAQGATAVDAQHGNLPYYRVSAQQAGKFEATMSMNLASNTKAGYYIGVMYRTNIAGGVDIFCNSGASFGEPHRTNFTATADGAWHLAVVNYTGKTNYDIVNGLKQIRIDAINDKEVTTSSYFDLAYIAFATSEEDAYTFYARFIADYLGGLADNCEHKGHKTYTTTSDEALVHTEKCSICNENLGTALHDFNGVANTTPFAEGGFTATCNDCGKTGRGFISTYMVAGADIADLSYQSGVTTSVIPSNSYPYASVKVTGLDSDPYVFVYLNRAANIATGKYLVIRMKVPNKDLQHRIFAGTNKSPHTSATGDGDYAIGDWKPCTANDTWQVAVINLDRCTYYAADEDGRFYAKYIRLDVEAIGTEYSFMAIVESKEQVSALLKANGWDTECTHGTKIYEIGDAKHNQVCAACGKSFGEADHFSNTVSDISNCQRTETCVCGKTWQETIHLPLESGTCQCGQMTATYNVPETNAPNVFIGADKLINSKMGAHDGAFWHYSTPTLVTNDGIPYVRFSGTGVGNMYTTKLMFSGNTTEEVGPYLVIRYRVPSGTSCNGTTTQIFASTSANSASGSGDYKDYTIIKDGEWNFMVCDLSQISKVENDIIQFIRYSPIDGTLAKGSAIHVSYLAFCSDLDQIKALYTGLGTNTCDHSITAATKTATAHSTACSICGTKLADDEPHAPAGAATVDTTTSATHDIYTYKCKCGYEIKEEFKKNTAVSILDAEDLENIYDANSLVGNADLHYDYDNKVVFTRVYSNGQNDPYVHYFDHESGTPQHHGRYLMIKYRYPSSCPQVKTAVGVFTTTGTLTPTVSCGYFYNDDQWHTLIIDMTKHSQFQESSGEYLAKIIRMQVFSPSVRVSGYWADIAYVATGDSTESLIALANDKGTVDVWFDDASARKLLSPTTVELTPAMLNCTSSAVALCTLVAPTDTDPQLVRYAARTDANGENRVTIPVTFTGFENYAVLIYRIPASNENGGENKIGTDYPELWLNPKASAAGGYSRTDSNYIADGDWHVAIFDVRANQGDDKGYVTVTTGFKSVCIDVFNKVGSQSEVGSIVEIAGLSFFETKGEAAGYFKAFLTANGGTDSCNHDIKIWKGVAGSTTEELQDCAVCGAEQSGTRNTQFRANIDEINGVDKIGGKTNETITVSKTFTMTDRKLTVQGWCGANSGVFRYVISVDGGQTWIPFEQGLPGTGPSGRTDLLDAMSGNTAKLVDSFVECRLSFSGGMTVTLPESVVEPCEILMGYIPMFNESVADGAETINKDWVVTFVKIPSTVWTFPAAAPAAE